MSEAKHGSGGSDLMYMYDKCRWLVLPDRDFRAVFVLFAFGSVLAKP